MTRAHTHRIVVVYTSSLYQERVQLWKDTVNRCKSSFPIFCMIQNSNNKLTVLASVFHRARFIKPCCFLHSHTEWIILFHFKMIAFVFAGLHYHISFEVVVFRVCQASSFLKQSTSWTVCNKKETHLNKLLKQKTPFPFQMTAIGYRIFHASFKLASCNRQMLMYH